MYYILCRSEYWTREGKKWSDWRKDFFDDNQSEDLTEIKERLKVLKERTKPIDKATKLKHEYKIEKE